MAIAAHSASASIAFPYWRCFATAMSDIPAIAIATVTSHRIACNGSTSSSSRRMSESHNASPPPRMISSQGACFVAGIQERTGGGSI